MMMLGKRIKSTLTIILMSSVSVGQRALLCGSPEHIALDGPEIENKCSNASGCSYIKQMLMPVNGEHRVEKTHVQEIDGIKKNIHNENEGIVWS